MPSARHGRSDRIPDPRHNAPRRAMATATIAVNCAVVGTGIAAGTPIEALQNRIADVPVPSAWWAAASITP